MKVSNSSLKTRRTYEAPTAEVIVVETQGVLCVSGSATTTGGGTESMNLTDVNWP